MKKLSLLFLFLLLLCSCQEEITTGSVYGTVTDYETGEAIKNASVSLLPSKHKSVVTGSDGYYEFNNLDVGRYEIEVQADGYDNNKKTVHINPASFEPCDITLKPILPVLKVSPDRLDFGTESKTLSFEIANDGEGVLDWTISEDSDWLVCEPMSGKTGKDISSIVVTVSREGLEKEHYSDNITISSNGGSKTIKVDLSVIPEIPVLEVAPTRLEFTTESTLAFDITNAGNGVLEWSLSEESDWFSCEPSSGTATTKPSSVVVTVSRNGLEKGSYSESIVVTSNGGSKVVIIKLAIDPIELTVTPEELDFGTVNSSLDVTLKNNSSKSIRYEVKTANSWLSVSKTSGTVTNTDKFSAIVSRQGLSAGEYDSEILISNEMGTISIPVRMAVAVNEKPVVTAESADQVTYNSAMLHGTVVSVGSSAISRYGFCWSENPEPTLTDECTNLGDCTSATAFNSPVANLKSETKYYCRAYAENNEGISYSDKILTFTTGALPKIPTVETGDVKDVDSSFAKVKGTLSSLGGCKVTSYGHVWAKTSDPVKGAASATDLGETENAVSFESELNDLDPATVYYVRAYATNEKGTAYGKEVVFTTAKGNVVLNTSDVTDIIHNAAVCGGKIVQLAGNEVKEAGVCWGIYDNPTLDDSFVSCDNVRGDSFSCRMSGLKMQTSYYVRAYVVTAEGNVFYGESKRFTTTKEVKLPELSMVTVTNIQTVSATVTATVVSDGNSAITECGFCWSTTKDPKKEDEMVTCDPNSKNMGKNITDLKENTTYYVRAWAKNAMGIAYGDVTEFTTKAVTLPELSAVSVENVGKTTAYASSEILSDGNSVISDYGFCWSTSQNPTIYDTKVSLTQARMTIVGPPGVSVFSTKITGLPGTSTIYLRAYAINEKGTGYSNETQFMTTDVDTDIWDGASVATKFGGGMGTSSDPIIICTADQLALLAKNVQGGTQYSGVYFKLTSNIGLNRYTWPYSGGTFAGIMDGNGMTIDGYNGISGLFKYNSGTIKNLTMRGDIVASKSNVGSISDNNTGTISNCISAVNIVSSYEKVGGIVGTVSDGAVKGCIFTGTIDSSSDYVGGIAGYDYSTVCTAQLIRDCVNKGSIIGSKYVGGIVGYWSRRCSTTGSPSVVPLKNCSNYGAVSGRESVGGIVGFLSAINSEAGGYKSTNKYNVQLFNCLNVAEISGTSSGGICGKVGLQYFNNCQNTSSYLGQYLGLTYLYMKNCVNYGQNGLVGSHSISNYYSTSSKYVYNYTSWQGGGYWLYDIVSNIGQEYAGDGTGSDNSGWFNRDGSGCYVKGTQDLVTKLNDYISTNLDNTYKKWKYEIVDGYARPVFD